MQIIENMTNEDYRKAKGISKTGLDLIAKSPAHFKGHVSEYSKAFDIGRAFHDIILTPDAYKNDYEILPQGFNSLLKASKERLQEIRGQGITPLSFDDAMAISAMRDSVMRLPNVAKLLENGKAEVSHFWQDYDTGIDCKCRPDFTVNPDLLPWCIDLKSSVSAEAGEFARSVTKYRYHVQDAFYSDGVYNTAGYWPQKFIFLVVEKKPPYVAAWYELDERAKEYGRELWQRDLETYKRSKESNEWHGYSTDIQLISLPEWAYRKD